MGENARHTGHLPRENSPTRERGGGFVKRNSETCSPTSIYLDDDSRQKLDVMSENTGQSRSQIMRSLIQGSDEEREKRLLEIIAELADMFVVR